MKRKKAAKRSAPPRRKAAKRGAGKRIKIEVFVPAHVSLDGAELGDLNPAQRLQLATMGSKRTSTPPMFVLDAQTWRKAMRTVAKQWKRYAHPYAAVAFVYLRMGGQTSSSHVSNAGAERVRGAAMGGGGGGRPSARATRSPVHVERVKLDELGYDDRGTYFGIGEPLWRVVSDEPYFDEVVRAHTASAARASVLQRYQH